MKRGTTTEEALKALADGSIEYVCLVKPQDFAAVVTLDSKAQELVILVLKCARRLTVGEILCQTQPFLYSSSPGSDFFS